jgi:bacterioferritin-associated ferredoxin
MYVCLCNGVSDRAVRKAIRRGAATVEDVGARCGAGTGCGGCRSELEALLAAHRPESADTGRGARVSATREVQLTHG